MELENKISQRNWRVATIALAMATSACSIPGGERSILVLLEQRPHSQVMDVVNECTREKFSGSDGTRHYNAASLEVYMNPNGSNARVEVQDDLGEHVSELKGKGFYDFSQFNPEEMTLTQYSLDPGFSSKEITHDKTNPIGTYVSETQQAFAKCILAHPRVQEAMGNYLFR